MGKSGIVATVAVVAAAVVMSTGAGPAQAAKLKLQIQPAEKAKAGKRACFTGRVSSGRRGVKGALIKLEGKETRTNSKGRLRICKTLHWGGTHAAFAFKGNRSDFDRFRVGSTGVTSSQNWHHMEVQYTAYPYNPRGNGQCYPGPDHPGGPDFGEGSGYCVGYSNPGTDGFLTDKHLNVYWNDGQAPISLTFNLVTDDVHKPNLEGWIDNPGARTFYLTYGQNADLKGVSGGSDPYKAGDVGGPWLLKATKHYQDPFDIVPDGYTIHVVGWYYDINSAGRK
ncbi:MAG: hypothetical protein ACSLFI_08690 [Solirubrobacterales bacterium]